MVEVKEDEFGIYYVYLSVTMEEDGVLSFERVPVQIADLPSELFFGPDA